MHLLDQHVGRYELWRDIPNEIKNLYVEHQINLYQVALTEASSGNAVKKV